MLLVAIVGCSALAQSQALRLEKVIDLPGVEGRVDHLTADFDWKRVYIAAVANGTVEVVDLRQGRRVGEIKGLKEPQGLLYMPINNNLYVATGGDGMVRSYYGTTLVPLNSISLGDDADNLRWDHQSNSVMVGYGDGAIAFLNLNLAGKAKAEVRLPAHPESFQVSGNGSGFFANLPRVQSVAYISLVPLAVSAMWRNLGALANFPMAVDPGSDRIFIACRMPARLLALDTKTGTVVERIETVGDADDLLYDESRGRIYVIGGEGFIDVQSVAKNGKLSSIDHILTAPGARTGMFVPGWNKVLVAAPHRDRNPARLLVYDLPGE